MSQPHHPHYEPPKPWIKIKPIEVVFCVAIIAILAATLIPIIRSVSISNGEEKCMETARQRSQATLMYAADYDQTLMPATRWQDALIPFLPDKALENRSCLEVNFLDKNGLGFAMDSHLSGVSLNSLESSSQRILFFETSLLQRNAHTPGTQFAARHRDMVTKQPHHGYLITLEGQVSSATQQEGDAATLRGMR